MSPPVAVARGDGPVILAFPHTATDVPDEIAAGFNDTGRALKDTDWHVDRLYAGLLDGATTVRAAFHRYVIDANRPPDDASLYPGQATTGLCPVTDFDGHPIWEAGAEPDADEIARRRSAYHTPYHAALAGEIARVRERHGYAVLYDCHSIRSRVPRLFDGVVPDLNTGTDSGATCAPEIEAMVADICAKADGYSHILNGRFRGGWTVRHHGRPAEGIHAIQMEIAQSAYMYESPPWGWAPERADRLRPVLARILTALSQWRPA